MPSWPGISIDQFQYLHKFFCPFTQHAADQIQFDILQKSYTQLAVFTVFYSKSRAFYGARDVVVLYLILTHVNMPVGKHKAVLQAFQSCGSDLWFAGIISTKYQGNGNISTRKCLCLANTLQKVNFSHSIPQLWSFPVFMVTQKIINIRNNSIYCNIIIHNYVIYYLLVCFHAVFCLITEAVNFRVKNDF